MSESTVVARIGKPHGLHGEVTVRLHTDQPERRLAVGAVLDTEADAGSGVPRTLTVRSTRVHRGIWLVAFEEVPDRTGAEGLRGTRLVLTGDAADAFMDAHDAILEGGFATSLEPAMRHREAMGVIQQVCLERCYRARDVLKMELSGAEAIQGLLSIFVGALADRTSLRGAHMQRLYPRQFQEGTPYQQLLRITDHISGMTDHYAVRLYRELRGMRYPGGRD